MGNQHKQLESKHAAARKRAREKKIRAKRAREEGLAEVLPNIVDALNDDLNPCIDLRLKIRDDGSYLTLIKREFEIEEQVLFHVGDEPIEALHGLDKKVERGVWKVSLPFKPDKTA